MQIGKDKALRLLIVDDSVEAAEAIVSGLRNAGIAVRPTRPENEDELKELLDSQTPDLIIAAHASRAVPLARTMALVVATGKDLPVLVLYDSIDDARLLEASAMGARGTILRGGQKLRARDGRIVEVRAAAEDLLEARCANPSALARAAYHLGNRHVIFLDYPIHFRKIRIQPLRLQSASCASYDQKADNIP